MLSGFTNLFGKGSEIPVSSCDGSQQCNQSSEASDWVFVENDGSLGCMEKSNCEEAAILSGDVTPPEGISSTPAKSAVGVLNSSLSTASSDEPSDFECFRGPYVSPRDVLCNDNEQHSTEQAVLSDASSQPEQLTHPSMDECWLVTPPACFVGAAESPVVTAGPLEDLLIEHPSMSVYRPHSSDTAMIDSSVSSGDYSPADSQSLPQSDAGDVSPRAVTPVDTIRSQRLQTQSVNTNLHLLPPTSAVNAAAWKGLQSRLHIENAPNALERKNRVRFLSGRVHAMKRSRRIARGHSGMNNSRHCQ